MALSGVLSTPVGSGFQLRIEWYASQNISSNTSSVTANLYWVSSGSGYSIDSSATKGGELNINGIQTSYSGAGLADLNGGQKKLIYSQTTNVSHESDGTKTVNFSAYITLNMWINGSYYGTVSVSGAGILDKIPRTSSLTSSPSWIAGEDFPISISRASTGFEHKVIILVKNTSNNWVEIKRFDRIITSETSGFDLSQNTLIFSTLAQRESTDTWIQVQTFYGGTFIGATDYYGVVKVPIASTISSSVNFNIGSDVTVNVSRSNELFTHVLRFYVGDILVHTKSDVEDSYVWSPNITEKNAMYNATPNSNTIGSKVDVITYYRGVRLFGMTTKNGTAKVTNSSPVFGTGYTYKDTEASVVSITGNDQYIVQNKSNVLVVIPVEQKATAQNGATMSYYEAKLNGSTIKKNWSNTSNIGFDFGKVDSDSSLTLTVKAVDSRGNYTLTSKVITVLPYSQPSVTFKGSRENGFETNATLTLSGSLSTLRVDNLNKNSIMSILNPSNAPTLSLVSNASSVLPASTYYVSYTWVNKYGETMASPEASIATTSGKDLKVVIPTFPLSATSANIYIGTSANTGTKQGSTTDTTYTKTTVVTNGTSKPTSNSTLGMQYRYKSTLGTTWGDWNAFSYTMDGKTYEAAPITRSFDNTKAWNVEVRVADKFHEIIKSIIIPVGQPIIFVDSVNKSLGVGKFPDGNGSHSIETSSTIRTRGMSGNYIDDEMLKDYMNGNVAISALGNDLVIGYKNTAKVRLSAPLYDSGGNKKIMDVDGVLMNESSISPSLLNGWMNYNNEPTASSGFANIKYWKDNNGVIHVSGMIKGGTVTDGTVLFNLPVGYRPLGQEVFFCACANGVPVRIDVRQNGNVTINTPTASNTWISLSGISFRAER